MDQISSGESELLCLVAEFLHALDSKEHGKELWLLWDEPDVHLHPDLQYKLIKFIAQQINDEEKIKILIATHSTAILSALSDTSDAAVAFLTASQKEIDFYEIDEKRRESLALFGAHPLTRVYYEMPVLLVEGDDDVRIWQQVVRSSGGGVKLHPVSCDSKNKISSVAKAMRDLVKSIYNDAKIYILNDGDGEERKSVCQDGITQMFLQCYGPENLLLTKEFLTAQKTNWDEVGAKIGGWLEVNQSAKPDITGELEALLKDRRHKKLKDSRGIVLSFVIDIKKIDSWEVLLGKFIWGKINNMQPEDEIYQYLGEDLVNFLKGQGANYPK